MEESNLNKGIKKLINKVNSVNPDDLNRVYPELVKLSLKINFPVYSLNKLLSTKGKNIQKDKNELYDGWIDDKKNTMYNTNTPGDGESGNGNNNLKIVIIIASAIVAIAIIGVVFFWLKGSNEGQINEEAAWGEAIRRNDVRAYKLYLEAFPRGEHMYQADSMLFVLQSEEPEPGGEPELDNGITIKLSKERIVRLTEGSSKEIRVNIDPANEEYKVSCDNNIIEFKANNTKKNIKVTVVYGCKHPLY